MRSLAEWWDALADGLDDAADTVLLGCLVAVCVGAAAAGIHALVTLGGLG